MRAKLVIASALILGVWLGARDSAYAFQSDPGFPATWSALVSQVDAACVALWLSSTPPKDVTDAPEVHFMIVDVLKGSPQLVKKGDRLTLRRNVARPQGLFFLAGAKRGAGLEWEQPQECSRAGFDYLAHAPALGGTAQNRLPYFIRFLDSSDPFIMPDVLAELSSASVEDMVALVPLIPRQLLRKQVTEAKQETHYLGLHAFMLGLCGNAEDAPLLAARIRGKSVTVEDGRIGIDEVMIGYLLLTGNKGMDQLDEWKVKDRSASFGDTYAMIAVLNFFLDNGNFLWGKGYSRIRKERLVQSFRLILEHPDCEDLAIGALARCGDWQSLDRVAQSYGKDRQIASTKRAVLRFMSQCSNAKPTEASAEKVAAAKHYLSALRAQDPEFFEILEIRRDLQKGDELPSGRKDAPAPPSPAAPTIQETGSR